VTTGVECPSCCCTALMEAPSRMLSPSRVRQTYQLLAMVLKAAVESGYLARSPCVGVRLPRPPRREMTVLTPDQVDDLAAAVPNRYRALIYVLAFGGLRWGEACALRRFRCDVLRARLDVAESVADASDLDEYFESLRVESFSSRAPYVRAVRPDIIDE
jgi:uncharacterized protein (DUF3084 family)